MVHYFAHRKKRLAMLGAVVVVALAIPVLGIAATLSNGEGSTCGLNAVGTFHFVNNQTGGASTPGVLTVVFSDGTQMVTASKVLNNTQHFYAQSNGSLVTAETNLPGRLQLSDLSCTPTKKK